MAKENKEKNQKYRIDIIVILSVILVSLVAFCVMELTRKEGEVAVVEVNGVTVAEYSLLSDGVFPINGGTNVLVIEGGAAYFNYSSCPTHTCEARGKIRYVGERIDCLPNRVSVVIRGEGGVDLVS